MKSENMEADTTPGTHFLIFVNHVKEEDGFLFCLFDTSLGSEVWGLDLL